MSCITSLRSTFLPEATGGGEWNYIGFSTSPSGPFGVGGNFPWATNALDNPSVNFSTIEQGYYKLEYFLGGSCGGSTEIVVPVYGGGDAGVSASLDFCLGDTDILNLYQELGASFDVGILEAEFSFTGDSANPAFSENGGMHPNTATIDVSLLAEGVYNFTLNITPQTTNPQVDCCDPTTATLTVTVDNPSIVISKDGCVISVDSITGCVPTTLELYSATTINGTYTATGVTSFPATVTSNLFYKVIATGCSCPTESNIVETTECCLLGTMTLQFSDDCTILLDTQTGGCTGAYLWQRSCDGGVTWQDYPEAGNNFFVQVTDNCCYRLTRACTDGSGCITMSDVLCATSCILCDLSLTTTQGACLYTFSVGTQCNGGTLYLQKLINGTFQNVASQALTSYPSSFVITSNGTYRGYLDCNDGCPLEYGSTYTYTQCGGTSCNSTVTLTNSNCVLLATVTNCPSPTYTFKDPTGAVVYTGPSNTYDASSTLDGVWTVEVTGCPDCEALTDSTFLNGCASTSCVCSGTLSVANCSDLTLSTSSCNGFVKEWLYRVDSGSPWSLVQTGGSTYTGQNNGEYVVRYVKAGCTDTFTNIISVSCITSCNCSNALSLNPNCTLDITSCAGYTNYLERLVNSVWTIVATNPSSPYTPVDDGFYRVRSTKTSCPTILSNNVLVNCTAGCDIAITSFINEANCGEVSFAWTGGSGLVNAIFQYAQVNAENCATASGWTAFSPDTLSVDQNTQTGTATITAQCDVCIRLIIIDTDDSCSPDSADVVVPCCCDDNPSIDQTDSTNTYLISIEDSLGNVDKVDASLANDSLSPNVSGLCKVTENGIEISYSPFTVSANHRLYFQYSNSLESALTNGDYIDNIRLYRSDTNAVVTVPLNPATAVLTGAGGTIVGTDLEFDSTNPSAFAESVQIAIINYLDTLSLTYELYGVSAVANGTFNIRFLCKHNPTLGFIGINRNDAYIDINIGGVSNVLDNIGVISTRGAFSCEYTSLCGELVRSVRSNAILSLASSNYNNFVILQFNPSVETAQNNSDNATCTVTTLTVINECAGATYLWSNGATTESIVVVGGGSYSVIVSCPDGCDYPIALV